MKTYRFALFTLLVLLLSACNPSAMIERMADEEMKALALEQAEALRKGEVETIWASLDPEAMEASSKEVFHQIAEMFPDRPYTKRSLVGYGHQRSSGTQFYQYVFEYEIDGAYWLTRITLKQVGESVTTYGIFLDRQEEPALSLSALELSQARSYHVLVLVAVVALPLISIFSLVVCLRTRGLKRKWLWCLFILIGVTSFKLNWTTGSFDFEPLSIQILSAGFTSVAGGPWIFSVSLPVGVFFFWEKRRKLRRAVAANLETPPDHPSQEPTSNPPA